MGRYTNRVSTRNQLEEFSEHRRMRGVEQIVHYTTPMTSGLPFEQFYDIPSVSRIWKHGDKLRKLAFRQYGSSQWWWVIAWFNKKPTDAHFGIGDTVHIPLDLSTILTRYGY